MGKSGVQVKFIDKDNLQLAIRKASAPESSRILRAVSVRMRGMQMEHFEKQVDASGKGWKPLRPATLARRRKGPGVGGVRILQDTGRLKSSIVAESNRDEAIAGTNTLYAATHQFGRGKIPAREFMYINDSEAITLIDFVANEILGPLMKN